ncbi:MAG TPA: sensor domain-containing diguanylate cyclase [Gemmatimonadota bacterium]|nr:sensor domain-containing diguanylate cyclase [Gemmatimonadota bacterium]
MVDTESRSAVEPSNGRTDRFTALCDLAQEMALVEDERSIYRVVLEVARKVLDFFNCAIMLIDSATDELVLADAHGYPPETQGLRLPLHGGKGLSCWVAENGQMLYVPDVRLDDRYVAGVPEARSELIVPIRIQGRTLGVLNVESDRVDAFDREEAMLLQALASQLAVALELHRARVELDQQSITDSLTGVYNRRYLDRLLPNESSRAERFDRPIALLMMDLDDFKKINDRYGHQRGDEVLVAFAEALVRTVRQIDSVVRYGGDEFLIVMVETAEAGAEIACRRIREGVLAAMRGSSVVPDDVDLSVSVGLAVRRPGEDIGAKLHEADRSLYRQKRR